LESGKDALDIKITLNQGKAHKGYKLPNIRNKFYTRSALVNNLIPLPSDGLVRAKYLPKANLFTPVIHKSKDPTPSNFRSTQ